MEHTKHFNDGDYTVFALSEMQRGIRKEVWHGWDYARKHRNEYEEQKTIILDAVREQLMGFRIIVAYIVTDKRLLYRIEASIMNNLYQQPPPICDIPDRGMQLAPRWDSEDPITIENKCNEKLYGLPSFLKI